nr:LysE family transporter [uncultured Rhodopila sp.]
MAFDHWLAFVAASAVLLAIPGPTVLLVISYALSHGRKAAAAVVTGVAPGDLTAMTASMLGHAYAVTALNPKSIVFFVAFVPQFLDATRPLLPQVSTLEATFVTLAALNAAMFALLGAAARRRMRQPRVRRLINRAGGSLLIGAGFLAAGWRRANA